MSFEFETQLFDGRMVYVVGEAEVEHRCDCDGAEIHTHVVDVDLSSVMDTETNLEVYLSNKDRAAISEEALDRVYRVANEECV